MKSLKKIVFVAVVAIATALPSAAQFRFGLKAGAAVSKLSFDSSVLDSDNRAGFTGGVMMEFNAPILNIGFDASVLYASRAIEMENHTDHRGYIDIPINFKWKIGLPLVGKVVTPFVTTGPDFSFLCSSQNFKDAWSSRKFDIAWNVGAGMQLLGHLQGAASYGFGLTNSASGDAAMAGSSVGSDLKDLNFKGKNRFWTITLAYLF